MSSTEEKKPQKSKRSFMSKLPSFRRKKQPSPESTPTKSATKPKKQKSEDLPSNKKDTQPLQDVVKYRTKSTSEIVESYEKRLSDLREEENNGNPRIKLKSSPDKSATNIYNTCTPTSITNPEYDRDVWRRQNQQQVSKGKTQGVVNKHEINANINVKPLGSPIRKTPYSPTKVTNYSNPHIDRSESINSTLSSSSSLSLSSPGSLTKVIGGPRPYRSVFADEPRGIKRQGSTPSEFDISSSCVSVSGSVSSLSPTQDDVATKVTVRSVTSSGQQQYPVFKPVESLSPTVSPKHTSGTPKREGAYTYDSSGWDSEDSSNGRTLTRGSYDVNAAQNQEGGGRPRVTSIVNPNFDLQAAAAMSPQLNDNARRERQQSLASAAKITTQPSARENTHSLVTVQAENLASAQRSTKETLISHVPAASQSASLANNNVELGSVLTSSSHSAQPSTPQSTIAGNNQPEISKQPSLPSSACTARQGSSVAVGTAAPVCGNEQNNALLTRVTSVTSPTPIRTPRPLHPLHHPQLSAMRNKMRSESFDSSDLDSLASDDLMCDVRYIDETFADQTDDSLLMQGSTMPGEQGFSPYHSMGKGKRLRNNSIEFLVASFDKRHRHHSTGQTYVTHASTPRIGCHANGLGSKETVVLEASTYRQMVQDLSSMKLALVKLSKMLQDPKVFSDMISASLQGRDVEVETMDEVAQCEQIETEESGMQTDDQMMPVYCEASTQSDVVQTEDRGIQNDMVLSGCQQCAEYVKDGRRSPDPGGVCAKSATQADGSRSSMAGNGSSTSSGEEHQDIASDGSESSGLVQGSLSPLASSHCSDDTSDDSAAVHHHHRRRKGSCGKHVRISDEGSDGSYTGRLKYMQNSTHSLGDNISSRSSSSSRLGKVRMSSSSDEGSGAVVRKPRFRNHSNSSNEGSDGLGSNDEKIGLPQLRRPPSKMQRPRQIQRPKALHQPGKELKKPMNLEKKRSLERGVAPPSKLQRPGATGHKEDGKQHAEQYGHPRQQEQHSSLGWQQMQLQQHQDKLQKQQQVAHKQLQENQQRIYEQQQKMHQEQQSQAALNLQKQQEILMEQQQQQLRLQQHLQQQHQITMQLQKQASQEKPTQKYPRPQGICVKRSSNQDLPSLQRKSPEIVKTTQELRHSSPDLIDQRSTQSTNVAVAQIHHSDIQNGTEGPKQKMKSRLPPPSSVSKLPMSRSSNVNSATKRDTAGPSHAKSNPSTSNGIPAPKSKLPSPKSPRRRVNPSGVTKIQKPSPTHSRQIPSSQVSNGSTERVASQLHTNQNSNPSPHLHQQHHTTTTTTTMTTITTRSIPSMASDSGAASRLKPVSRLAQPKVKVQSRIPKGSGIPVRGREAN